MQISEPTTALTDYLITVSCFTYAGMLMQGSNARASLLWPIGMSLLGLAALAGGTFHGFGQALSESSRGSLWNLTMVLIGAGAGFMVSGALAGVIGTGRSWFIWGVITTLAAVLLLFLRVGFHRHFNHNDLFHCIVLVALYLFYRGARLVQYTSAGG